MSGVTDPAEPYFKDGGWGWDGTVWRKLPLIFGYSGVLGERVSEVNATAGSDQLATTAVLAGEIHVIQVWSAKDNISALTRIRAWVTTGGTYAEIYWRKTFEVQEPAMWQGELILEEGAVLTVEFVGTVLNDDLYLEVAGYKMKIAE